MVITDYLERNARLYGSDSALVEINPSEERDNAVTWRDFNLIENANPDAPYRAHFPCAALRYQVNSP